MAISSEEVRRNLLDLHRRRIARSGLHGVAAQDVEHAIDRVRAAFGVHDRCGVPWAFSPRVEQRARELCDELEALFAGATLRPIPERMAELAQTDEQFQQFIELAKAKPRRRPKRA